MHTFKTRHHGAYTLVGKPGRTESVTRDDHYSLTSAWTGPLVLPVDQGLSQRKDRAALGMWPQPCDSQRVRTPGRLSSLPPPIETDRKLGLGTWRPTPSDSCRLSHQTLTGQRPFRAHLATSPWAALHSRTPSVP